MPLDITEEANTPRISLAVFNSLVTGGLGNSAASMSGTSSKGNAGCHLLIHTLELVMGGSRD